MENLKKLAEGMNHRFPEGNEVFQITTRILEECGEVAQEVNRLEMQKQFLNRSIWENTMILFSWQKHRNGRCLPVKRGTEDKRIVSAVYTVSGYLAIYKR